jgi:hypothetical protein
MPVQKTGQIDQNIQVHDDLIVNAGPLDLYGHGSAVKEHCPMDLGEGCSGKRRFVEKGKEIGYRHSQLRSEDLFDFLVWKALSAVLKACQRFNVLGAPEGPNGWKETALI